MFNYFQPEFYRFSEDSTLLAKLVAQWVSSLNKADMKGLDLGCGCGVIGLEILQQTQNNWEFDFCDIQPEFFPYFKANYEELKLSSSHNISWIGSCFSEIVKAGQTYDLIVSNPPYYREDTYRHSENFQKKRCRAFKIEEVDLFLKTISQLLCDKSSRAFLCFPHKNCEELNIKNFNQYNLHCEKKVLSSKINLLVFSRL